MGYFDQHGSYRHFDPATPYEEREVMACQAIWLVENIGSRDKTFMVLIPQRTLRWPELDQIAQAICTATGKKLRWIFP